MNQLSGRYLDDFAVGQTFGSGRVRIDKEQIFAFAAEFDPQPFHLDEAAAHKILSMRYAIRVRMGEAGL
jgi:acyl dehydratase